MSRSKSRRLVHSHMRHFQFQIDNNFELLPIFHVNMLYFKSSLITATQGRNLQRVKLLITKLSGIILNLTIIVNQNHQYL